MRNSTIIPKKKTCSSCGVLCYLFSRGRCQQCATVEGTQRRLEAAESYDQGESIANLIQDLDAVFSKYIRLKYSDSNGICECFTCGFKNHYSQIQNGHFIPRGNMATRFDEQNNYVQCVNCNCHLEGNLEVYAERLGKEVVESLQDKAREVVKFGRDELKGMIAEYRFKYKLIEKKVEQRTGI